MDLSTIDAAFLLPLGALAVAVFGALRMTLRTLR
jgi:hypothetical protein